MLVYLSQNTQFIQKAQERGQIVVDPTYSVKISEEVQIKKPVLEIFGLESKDEEGVNVRLRANLTAIAQKRGHDVRWQNGTQVWAHAYVKFEVQKAPQILKNLAVWAKEQAPFMDKDKQLILTKDTYQQGARLATIIADTVKLYVEDEPSTTKTGRQFYKIKSIKFGGSCKTVWKGMKPESIKANDERDDLMDEFYNTQGNNPLQHDHHISA